MFQYTTFVFSDFDWNWHAMEAHVGDIVKMRLISFTLGKTLRISLNSKLLVPVQYREYKYDPFTRKDNVRDHEQGLPFIDKICEKRYPAYWITVNKTMVVCLSGSKALFDASVSGHVRLFLL